MTVVLAGRPNSGKSSLLNRLAGYDAAIVTAIPGTTRDVLRERIDIDGLPLHVLDTPACGLGRLVEREGVRRAAAEMSRADACCSSSTRQRSRRRGVRRERRALPADVPVTLVSTRSTWRGLPRADTVRAPAHPRVRRHRSRPRPAALAPQGLRQFPDRR
jgi:tRNA modification GTPase